MNILVVEDDTQTGKILLEELSDRGNTVALVRTYADFLREITEGVNFDLAVVDWEFPERAGDEARDCGVDVLRVLRGLIPRPVTVVFSGLSRVSECREHGLAPDHHVLKGLKGFRQVMELAENL